MNTSDILNQAADLIEHRGWTQGAGWDGGGKLCLEGGIIAAAGIPEGLRCVIQVRDCDAYKAVASYLELGERHPYTWNDETGRTQADVVGVLRAAAVIEAAREEQDAAYATYAHLISA